MHLNDTHILWFTKFMANNNINTMKIIKTIALAAACLLMPVYVDAQVRLTDEEKETLQVAVKQKLDYFQDQLGTIASKKTSPENKDRAIKSTLALFIGKGEPYTTYSGYNNSVEIVNDGVKMQTSSVRSHATKSQLMKRYLNRLKGMLGYTDINIESADAVKVGDIHLEPGTNRYNSVASICQHFVGYRDGYKVYEDYTVKKVKIYIEPEILQLPDGEQVLWKIQLGDMVATETWR